MRASAGGGGRCARAGRASALLALAALACGPGEEGGEPDPRRPPPAEEPGGADRDPDAATRTLDEEGLLVLAERIPPGSSAAAVRRTLPGLGGLEPEGAGTEPPAPGLTEARLPVRAFGRPGTLEANFLRDSLYALYVALDSLPCPVADTLYARVRATYGERFGPGGEEGEREPGYSFRTTVWEDGGLQWVATLGIQDGRCRLGWGYQREVSSSPRR